MDKHSKTNLVNLLKVSTFADTSKFHTGGPQWQKAPEKVKNQVIIEETAKGIAKKKIAIQQIIEDNQKLSYQIERIQHFHDERFNKNEKLQQRKNDLESQYKALSDENTKELGSKKNELDTLNEQNNAMKEEISRIYESGEKELRESEARIQNLMKLADRALEETHIERELNLKYSVATLSHLEVDLENMKALSDSQSKKVEILLNLLESSKEHLTNSIEQKTQLLNQTKEAAAKMNKICEETLREEQEFYEKQEYDKMHTAPHILVKRRERKQ